MPDMMTVVEDEEIEKDCPREDRGDQQRKSNLNSGSFKENGSGCSGGDLFCIGSSSIRLEPITLHIPRRWNFFSKAAP